MEEKLRQLLDQMPERPPRSKLEPHADVIRELRKKRRTYGEIAAFFREHLQLPVAPSTIHDFVKTRARQARHGEAVMPETPQPFSPPVQSESPARTPPAPVSPNDVRERMRALRSQPIAAKPEPARFHFDPHAPLTLNPKLKEK